MLNSEPFGRLRTVNGHIRERVQAQQQQWTASSRDESQIRQRCSTTTFSYPAPVDPGKGLRMRSTEKSTHPIP
jgi:hypothetical protein